MPKDLPDADEHHPELVVSWWLPSITLAMFLVLGLICRGGNTLAIDLDVSHWVQQRSSGWADQAATIGNILGGAAVAITILVIAVIWAIIFKRWRELLFLVIVASGRLIGLVLKSLFDSPRPNEFQVHVDEVFSGYGFPSGHTLTATLSFGTLAFLVAYQYPGSRLRWLLLIPWGLAIFVTAFARIYLGAHWFTDTLGGALLGVGIVLLATNVSGVLVSQSAPHQANTTSA